MFYLTGSQATNIEISDTSSTVRGEKKRKKKRDCNSIIILKLVSIFRPLHDLIHKDARLGCNININFLESQKIYIIFICAYTLYFILYFIYIRTINKFIINITSELCGKILSALFAQTSY